MVFLFSPETVTQISAQELSSLHSLLQSYSFKELTFKKCQFSDTGISVLCDIIRACHSLTSADFSHCRLSHTNTHDIFNALQSNSDLQMVNLSYNDIDIATLLNIFPQFAPHQSPQTITVYPHSIDFSRGVIHYAKKVKTNDVRVLLNALKSKVPIKRIQCSGMSDLNFSSLVMSFQILSVNNSLIYIDVAPHFIDVESGIFSFSPQDYTKITAADNVSALGTLEIKDLRMHKCDFTIDALKLFCAFIRASTLLTSLDLSYCNLYDVCLLRIIECIQNISSLTVRNIDFGAYARDNASAKALAELLKVNTTLSEIDLVDNYFEYGEALEILKILEVNSTIECINLGGSDVNENIRKEIETISSGRIVF
ncbi:hypothetical protein GEMRC1_009723 [Eukaryota sp. GEM-RC1]